MAKRGRPAGGGWIARVEEKPTALENFAADLGKFLGSVQSKATNWLDQRKAITDQLTQIRDTANQYLQQLTVSGAGSTTAAGARRRGRPPGPGRRGPGRPRATGSLSTPAPARKKRTMSAAARKRISVAQKARWAKLRKSKQA